MSILPVLIALVPVLRIEYVALFGAAFLFGNYYLSPDLDINSRVVRRWGILAWIWTPYRSMFRHRSFFTHSGPISATLRILYLLLPLLLILAITHTIAMVVQYVVYYRSELLLCYIAVCLADLLHTLADFMTFRRVW